MAWKRGAELMKHLINQVVPYVPAESRRQVYCNLITLFEDVMNCTDLHKCKGISEEFDEALEARQHSKSQDRFKQLVEKEKRKIS